MKEEILQARKSRRKKNRAGREALPSTFQTRILLHDWWRIEGRDAKSMINHIEEYLLWAVKGEAWIGRDHLNPDFIKQELLATNGFFPSFLEQSRWPQNYSFLGTSCKLGIRGCWIGWHAETARDDIRQHDSSYVYIFCIVYEVCMDGAATELPTPCMPCLKWICPALSTIPLGNGSRVLVPEERQSLVTIICCWVFLSPFHWSCGDFFPGVPEKFAFMLSKP